MNRWNFWSKLPFVILTTWALAFTATTMPAELLPVTSGLQMWLRADAGVATDANGVTSWTDQSGNGNSVSQTTPDRQPALVSDAFGNGLPALRFTDDRLDGPAVVTGSGARSIFMVVRQNIDGAANHSILTLNRVVSGDRSLYRITPEFGVQMSNAAALYGNHPIDRQFRILTIQNPAGAMSDNTRALLDGIRIKPSLVSSPGQLLNTGTGGIRIGDSEGDGGAFFSGDIAEIILYDRDLTAAEANEVGHYLESKYGLKTSFVSDALNSGKVQVWLLGGQSNMRGHGNPVEITDPRYESPQGDVMLWHNQHNETVFADLIDGTSYEARDITGVGPQAFGFEQLTWGGGRTENTQEGGFGPELSFGRAMADAFPEQRIALVKHAIGGTNLHTEWNPNANGGTGGGVYLDFVETTHAALQALTDAGLEYEIKGMLWMQGEADTNSQSSAQAYKSNIESLIAAVRQEFGVPEMPFLMGLTYGNGNFLGDVRAGQSGAAAADPLVSVVNVDDLAATGLVTYDN
ncbi:MAG: sialate O-acetylesterase, partial [Opitutales bacterium]